ncbi:MAG: hypothetical protein LBQ88_09405 [Treponema sp.]|jgi:7-cyano-7-deazaguanine synthase in queuosine biosynthesis|nr:hypothetical protein [Treponema sp.]
MNKNILQALSGGFDSTCLLIKNLENGDHVYPVYIKASSVDPVKRQIELKVIKELLANPEIKTHNLHDLITVPLHMRNIDGIFSFQPVLWTLGLFCEVKKRRDFYDEVHIGYIMNDSAVSYLGEIKRIWRSFFSLSFPEYNKIPELEFPLVKYSKEMVINKLLYFQNTVAYNCWTCERPSVLYERKKKNHGGREQIIEHCGRCAPCKKIKEYIGLENLPRYRRTEHRELLGRLVKRYKEKLPLDDPIILDMLITCEKLDEKESTHITSIVERRENRKKQGM